MNPTRQELELLERATANPAADTDCSGEEGALREGWLALAHLVEHADAEAQFDDQAFLQRVSKVVQRRPAASRRAWLLLLGALAASLVIGLAGAYVASLRRNEADISQLASSQPGADHVQTAHTSDRPELSWDDSLDERIMYVNHSLFRLGSGTVTSSGSLESLGVQLEQFGREIDSSSL